MTSIMEAGIAHARSFPNAVSEICDVLGVRQMRRGDHSRTKLEVRDYVVSGDIGALRALLQHAKARRELWRSRSGI